MSYQNNKKSNIIRKHLKIYIIAKTNKKNLYYYKGDIYVNLYNCNGDGIKNTDNLLQCANFNFLEFFAVFDNVTKYS